MLEHLHTGMDKGGGFASWAIARNLCNGLLIGKESEHMPVRKRSAVNPRIECRKFNSRTDGLLGQVSNSVRTSLCNLTSVELGTCTGQGTSFSVVIDYGQTRLTYKVNKMG